MRYHDRADLLYLDKAVGGVGYVEDHQSPIEFLQKDNNGMGKFGKGATQVAI